MRKLITLIAVLLMTAGMAMAQNINNDGVFSHMYVGVKGGAMHTFVENAQIDYNAALELGKDVTPITGFSLEGVTNMNKDFNVQNIDVFGNAKFNLMNLFSEYKGYPRRVEIRTVTGIGWNHNVVDNENPNDMALQAGLEFDFNLGKNRNWYITLSPVAYVDNVVRGGDIQTLVKENGTVKTDLGIAYRFGNRNYYGKQSHNFMVNENEYTEKQYKELYTLYDECMQRPVRVDTVTVEKTLVVEKIVKESDNISNAIVMFAKNSSKLTANEVERLNVILNKLDKNDAYVVLGSADRATGTEEYNMNLATERANAVKNIMIENGFENVTVQVNLDEIDNQNVTRCAIIKH